MNLENFRKLLNKITLVLVSVTLFGISTSSSAGWGASCASRPKDCEAPHLSWNEDGPSSPIKSDPSICGESGTFCIGGDNNYAPRSGCGCCIAGHRHTMHHGLVRHYCR